MAESARDRVACPVCTKKYRWRAQVVAQKIRCKSCESVFRVPADPDSEAELVRAGPKVKEETSGASGYELDTDHVESSEATPGDAATGGGKCPSCNSPVAAHAVICIKCGFNLKEGKKIKTSVEAGPAGPARRSRKKTPPPPDPPGETVGALTGANAIAQAAAKKKAAMNDLVADTARKQLLMDRHYPIALIAIGVVLILLNAFVLAPMESDTILAAWQLQGGTGNSRLIVSLAMLVKAGVRFVVQVPILLLGILAVAKMFGSSYGTLLTAMLKLAALAIMVSAVNDCVGQILDIITGGLGGIGWPIQFAFEFGVFITIGIWLFEMEYLEVLVLYCIMVFLPFAVMFFLLPLILITLF